MKSVFLKSLLGAFQGNPEIEQFTISPPKNAGSIYAFTQPYLHCSTNTFFSEQPSLDLEMQCAALSSALEYYLHRHLTQANKPFPPECFGPQNADKLLANLNAFFKERGEEIEFVASNPVYGEEPLLGVKLANTVFPVMPLGNLVQLLGKLSRQSFMPDVDFGSMSTVLEVGTRVGAGGNPSIFKPERAAQSSTTRRSNTTSAKKH
jgi:hypothetical protein